MTELEYPVIKSLHKSGGKQVERYRKSKIALEASSVATSMSLSAASTATGQGMLAAMGGATISTGGVALIAGSAALSVGAAAMSGRSAYKTHQHIAHLNDLHMLAKGGKTHKDCTPLPGSAEHRIDHSFIAEQALPWVIRQKKHKRGKKAAGAAMLSPVLFAYAVARKGYKAVNGTLGKKRNKMAQIMARHMITCQCSLTDAIAAELLGTSGDELSWLKCQDSNVVGSLLMQKMKSK